MDTTDAIPGMARIQDTTQSEYVRRSSAETVSLVSEYFTSQPTADVEEHHRAVRPQPENVPSLSGGAR